MKGGDSVDRHANQSYFIDIRTDYFDGDGNSYRPDIIFDETENMHITMFDTTNPIGTHTYSEHGKILFIVNGTAIEKTDKIIVYSKILDKASANITNAEIWFGIVGGERLATIQVNITDQLNGTAKTEIPIDAIKKLKIQQAGRDVHISVVWYGNINNMITGARVELYDIEKVDTNNIANIMLAISGIVIIIGAFTATPWINPSRRFGGRRWRR